MDRYLIIGCGRQKADSARYARELYTGSLFRAARAHVEAIPGVPYMILSAKYGLVRPLDIIEPYDRRLTGPWTGWHELRVRVTGQLRELGWHGVLEVHAGHDYASLLTYAIHLDQLPLRVVSPVAGLMVGRRLAWYRAERLRRAA